MTTSKHPHLIDLNDYPVSWWKEVVDLGEKIKNNPEVYSGACHNKIMATLFYEPSTRTQMSFQTAMLRLGGRLIGFDNPANSSVSKGETLKDTTKIVSNYADILVMRHPVAGAAKAAALSADCPVINAGDSGHLHPTQTLTDLLTLKCEKGRLDHLTIGLCGDLINGRTVHSLIKAMTCFEGNQFILISTPELKLPSYVKDILTASGCPFRLPALHTSKPGQLPHDALHPWHRALRRSISAATQPAIPNRRTPQSWRCYRKLPASRCTLPVPAYSARTCTRRP